MVIGSGCPAKRPVRPQNGKMATSGVKHPLAGAADALTFAPACCTSPRRRLTGARCRRLAAAFALTALVQVVVAAVLAARPGRRLLVVAALLNIGAAAVWLVSRQTGLPLFDELAAPEAVGVQDLTTAVMEVVAALAALFSGRPTKARSPWPSPAWALAVIPC